MGPILSLLLVALSVGLSNFAGAVGIGLSGVDRRTRLRVGVAFGLFEALMPVLGLLIGHDLAARLGGYSGYVGGLLLILTGVYTIWQGRREHEEVERGNAGGRTPLREGRAKPSPRTPPRAPNLVMTAFALSIDNLVVGFALGVYNVSVFEAAVVMGVVSVLLSLLGLELGSRLGKRVEAWSEELGGGVLVLIGLALAFGLLR
jgi:putative Mn2+ efflux pump MntP